MKKNAILLRDRIIVYFLCHADPLLTLFIKYVLREEGPSDTHKPSTCLFTFTKNAQQHFSTKKLIRTLVLFGTSLIIHISTTSQPTKSMERGYIFERRFLLNGTT